MTATFASLFIQTPSVHAVAPTGFTSQTYEDSDGDGTIDQVVVVINGGEVLTTCTVTDTEVASDWTYVGNDIGGSLATTGNTHTCVLGTATVTLKITAATASTTGHTTAPTIAYNNADVDNSIANASGALGTVIATSLSDGAAPVVVSVSPADLATKVARNSNVVITFSEAMVTTFDFGTEFTTSPDPGNWASSFSAGDTVVTLTHTNFACSATVTITTAEATIDAAAGTPTGLVTTGPEDGDWSFTSKSCGTSSGGSSGRVMIEYTYEVDVTYPNGGEELTAGQPATITWSSGGTGTINYVNLLYSADGGLTYNTIATNERND
ncbi:Ig-like domain-containing protein, partial [Patescibacteria group bacterium]|nr:Ig-like domain-containing protein [Patescibacteria group bacterium]